MAIHFPRRPGVYTINTTVAFPAQLNGFDVICEIAVEAPQDHFGASSASGPNLVAAFEANRAMIEVIAREKLPQRAPAGRCVLESADF